MGLNFVKKALIVGINRSDFNILVGTPFIFS